MKMLRPWIGMVLAGLLASSQALGGASAPPSQYSQYPNTVAITGGTITGTTLSGWSVALGASDTSSATPSSGGSGNAVGDSLTLNDGCSTHTILGVIGVTSGAVTSYVINARGSCATAPANPVSVLSTTGSGTGAKFNMTYAPLVAGLSYQPNGITGGNLFIGNGPAPGFYGTETTLVGGNAGNHLTGNSGFDVAVGTGACGGSSAGTITLNNSTCVGVDAGRNIVGTSTGLDLYGSSTLKNQTSNVTALSAFGGSTFFNLNVAATPANLAGFGPGVCQGQSGLATFTTGACFGSVLGANLKGLTQFVLLGSNVGNSTLTDGNGVILIGSGQSAVDAPTSLVRHWTNIENSIIVATTHPTITSGFGTGASVLSVGSSSAGFQVNVGTGGTASSGVLNVASHSNTNSNAPTGWMCKAVNNTNSASFVEEVIPTDQQTVTITNYSRTTGAATAWTAGDVLTISCNGF